MTIPQSLPLSPHKREVLRAWLDGRTPQKRVCMEDTWEDFDPNETAMVFGDDLYRIKPAPTRRFWKPEEIPIEVMVRKINSPKWIGMILGVSGHGEAYTSTVNNITKENFIEFEWAIPGPANSVTWVPAGVEE